jgi:hypothetical protein
MKIDAEIVVPEKVRGDKANINSDTLGTYAPHGQSISTVYPYVKYIRAQAEKSIREQDRLRVTLYKGRGTKVPQSYTQKGTTQQMSSVA